MKIKIIKRLFHVLLLIILSGVFVIPVFAGNRASGSMTLDIRWLSGSNTAEYDLYEDKNWNNLVGLRVSYSNQNTSHSGYQPGELVITVKGIGNVKRNSVLPAIVGADKAGAETKTREWSYTWDQNNDQYTFTNNYEIPANTVISGYFELLWNISARESIHEYQQDGIYAELYGSDGIYVRSRSLSFHNRTKTDRYLVNIEPNWIYSYEGLTEDIDNPEDYIYIKYCLDGAEELYSRGLNGAAVYHFCVDENTTGEGVIVIDPKDKTEKIEEGLYKTTLWIWEELSERYIYVLYPKEPYLNSSIAPSLVMYGTYWEGDDNGQMDMQQLARVEQKVLIPEEFFFVDFPGEVYDFWKDTYYDKYVSEEETLARNGDVSGKKVSMGTSQRFYLEGHVFVPADEAYTLEIVDDYLYTLNENGEYRQLNSEEYYFEKIILPGTDSLKNTNQISIESNKYVYRVYAYQSGELVTDTGGLLVCEDRIQTGDQSIHLPENTTSIKICIEDLAESMEGFSIPVDINFCVTKDFNLKNGKIINTSFIRLYDKENVLFNDSFSKENYIMQDTNLDLAKKDLENYGMYLDREKDTITIYEADKCQFEAITRLGDIQADGLERYTTAVIGASFSFPEEQVPNQFSLYTVLPKGTYIRDVNTPRQFWDVAAASGMKLSSGELYSCLEVEVIDDYRSSQRQYLAIHFRSADADISRSCRIEVKFPLAISQEYYSRNRGNLSLRSCVLLDGGYDVYTLEKIKDTGQWLDETALAVDIDQDEDVEEYLDAEYDYLSYVYAASSEFQITKYVKTEFEKEYTQLPDVPIAVYDETYVYRLKIKNGHNTSKNIVVMDVLEESENSSWKGTLQKILVSGSDIQKNDYQILYSQKTDPSWKDNSWTTEYDADTRAIAVDFGNYELQKGENIIIDVYMTAPEKADDINMVTENRFSAGLQMEDLSTGEVTSLQSLLSNPVQVRLSAPLHTITVKKKDAVSGIPLAGAVFQLVDQDTGEVIKQVVSNVRGDAIWTGIPENGIYEIHEVTAPKGYLCADTYAVQMGKEDVNIEIENQRQSGTIRIIKTNRLDTDLKVEGAVYGLFDHNGILVQEAVTNEKGIAEFKNLSWGTYKVKEHEAATGYLLDDQSYTVSIGADTVEDIQVLSITDAQEGTIIEITKYETLIDGTKTESPTAGCVFELYRYKNDQKISYGSYVTDSHGYIQINESIPYDTYYVKEIRCPSGYSKADIVSFHLAPDSRNISLQIYNQRRSGSILLIKKDNLGNSVTNAVYELYDEQKKNIIATGTTDAYGNIEWSDLEWGTYYLKEKSAPECYMIDLEWKEIQIDGGQLHKTVTCINETKKGMIQLTKTDETGTIVLEGAEFNLYQADGTLIREKLVTDTKGELTVSDLEWGSYYFLETKAPGGYVISDEYIRFAVNSENAGYMQKLTAVNAMNENVVSVTKTIQASDLHAEHGDVGFFFCLTGTDQQDKEHTYYRMITFDGDTIWETDTVSKTITFSGIPDGIYQLKEEETSRYYLKEIRNMVNCSCEDQMVQIDLIEHETAEVEFYNEKYEHQGFSDAAGLANILKPANYLTGIKVKWTGEAYAGAFINRNDLKVTAFYDNGDSRILNGEEYVIDRESLPMENGEYEIVVSYSERNVTRNGSFSVNIEDGIRIPKRIEVAAKDGTDVYIGTELREDMFTVTAIYSDGSSEILTGAQVPKLIEDTDHAVTINSPNWPKNYPNDMLMEENYWEYTFEDADAVKTVFDWDSETHHIDVDYIYIRDDTGIPVTGKLGGGLLGGKKYMVYGNYIHVAMCSDGNTNEAGFLAELIPCYYDPAAESAYSIDVRRVPSEIGEFEVNVTTEYGVSGSIVLSAIDRPVASFYMGVPNEKDVTAHYYIDGRLHITGTGNTRVYTSYYNLPWYNYREEIYTAVIDPQVMPTSMDHWFSMCESLRSLNQIPDSVTSLASTFSQCILLEQIPELPENVTILNKAFNHCRSIKEAPEIPYGVTDMEWAFNYCNALTVPPVIPDTVTGPSGLVYTFANCTELLSAPELPENYQGSIDSIFRGCKKLEQAPVIPDGVTSMEYAFYQCNALTVFPVIPEGIPSLDYTFYRCYSAASIPVIPDSVTSMNSTFENCYYMKTGPKIPASVLSMDSCFEYCMYLTGNLEIDANPESYSDCFKNASWSNFKAKLTLSGTSSLLEELAATKSSNSVIEIS